MAHQLTPSEHVELWDAFRRGDPNAFAELYDGFAGDLYRYGFNLVRNKPLVEDCLHELFVHLHNKRAGLGPTDNIRFYLFRALRRRLLAEVSRFNQLDSTDYGFERAEFVVESYERVLVKEQLAEQQRQVLLRELAKLPNRQKEVLYLVYMKGMSYQQAAEVMDITLKTIYNTINLALGSLRVYVRISLAQRGILLGLSAIVLRLADSL